jgi:hypothetical protein
MLCSASQVGLLQNCTVISEAPTGQGFGAAALSLANGMELKRTTADGQPVAGRSFVVPVKFDPGLLASGFTITKPEWTRWPTGEAFSRYIPVGAIDGLGHTRVRCTVTERGLLDGCTLLEESPKGYGYGIAALKLTALFTMSPMTVDGRPIGGAVVDVPINFVGNTPHTYDSDDVILDPPWIAAPTRAEMAAVFPDGAVGKNISARVIFRCGLRRDGSLESCSRISEAPMGKGFGQAAQSLIKDFRLPPEPKSDPYGFRMVDVPFMFSDPRQPAPPPDDLREPIWIRGMDPASLVKIFPQAALKAGRMTGRASVECAVVADGTLAGCAAISEDPAGYGFGEAAVVIARAMQMSPWTRLGEPVGGAKVILPIRMVLPPAPPPAPSAKP